MKLSKATNALIGVLVGNMHPRRPVRYMRHGALVSKLYPLPHSETGPSVALALAGKSASPPADTLPTVSLTLDAEVRTVKYEYNTAEHQPGFNASVAATFNVVTAVEYDLSKEEPKPSFTPSVSISIAGYQVSTITQDVDEPAPSFTPTVTITLTASGTT